GLNPARYVIGLSESARRTGAAIAPFTAVERVARQGRRWSVTTQRGSIDAADLLIATNGYSDGAAQPLRRRLLPVGSYIVATEPLEATLAHSLLPRRRMAFDSKHFLYHFRVTSDRRLVFGGRAEFSRPTPASTRRAAAILRRGMTTGFPQLANVRIDFAWGGDVAFTRDRKPPAGRLGGGDHAGRCSGRGGGDGDLPGRARGASAIRRAGQAPVARRDWHPLSLDTFVQRSSVVSAGGRPLLSLAGRLTLAFWPVAVRREAARAHARFSCARGR